MKVVVKFPPNFRTETGIVSVVLNLTREKSYEEIIKDLVKYFQPGLFKEYFDEEGKLAIFVAVNGEKKEPEKMASDGEEIIMYASITGG